MNPITPLTSFPEFANINPGVQPSDPKYSQGFVPADTFPAEWANYLFNRSSKGITALNSAVRSIWLELESVLTSYGITASAESTDQILTALSKIYPKITSCSTGASVAAKEIAISGNVLKTGDLYVITFTNGNTAANPTLSINSGTAYPICDANGVALGSGAWEAGNIVKLLFVGNKYIMAAQPVVDKIERNNMNPPTSNAVAQLSTQIDTTNWTENSKSPADVVIDYYCQGIAKNLAILNVSLTKSAFSGNQIISFGIDTKNKIKSVILVLGSTAAAGSNYNVYVKWVQAGCANGIVGGTLNLYCENTFQGSATGRINMLVEYEDD